MDQGVQFTSAPIRHLRTTVDGMDTFYREAGPADAPVVLLPHGYPASSFVYRNLMARAGKSLPSRRARPARVRLQRNAFAR
jgi:pimeloyl-ACP methyl ester carboxylesterase